MTERFALRHDRVLQRLIESRPLVETIRLLPAPVLGLVVAEVGVEDAGEIISLATTDQLTHLFDEDVFDDERVAPERFALWLEVLLEAGDAFAADRVVALPEDLLYAAVNGFVRVFDLDALAVEIGQRADLAEANDRLEAARTEELLGRLLVVRRASGWDAVWTTPVAMAERHGELVERLLARLSDATMDRVADDGLSTVLSSEEMLDEDAAADHEERRALRGYVSTSDARAFLALARRGDGDPDTRDAITAAWFRRLAPRSTSAPTPALDLAAVLERAGLAHLARPALPSPGGEPGPAARLRAGLEALAARSPELRDARMEELSYLANVLSADATLGERRRRSVEAVEEALAVCGAALVHRSPGPADDADVLAARPLDLLFREGALTRS